MKQTKTAAAKIRAYVKQHPKAKPNDIAAALEGVTLRNVYATLSYDKKAKKGIPRVPRKSAKVAAYKAGKSQGQVDKYWEAVGEVQKAALSPERIAELTAQAGRPKLRMQAAKDTLEIGGLRLTELANGRMRWVKAALEGGPTEEELNAPDNVNHPAHYKVGGIETIDFIEAKKLGYNLGNVVKYITRADHKGNKLEDLRKAQWYLTRELSMLK